METIRVTPSMLDPDSGDAVTILSVKNLATATQPAFVNIANNMLSFSINPTLMSEVGIYTIIVSITDTKLTAMSSFSLTVTN
jgi:hypothetical protein